MPHHDNLYCKLDRYNPLKAEDSIVGYLVSGTDTRPDPDKVEVRQSRFRPFMTSGRP